MATEDTATSTRVFVSGLPPSFSSDDLRKHFNQKHSVNDAHVFSDRRIGFVGFHDHDTAQKAAKYFNRSFIRMSKISVSLARPVDVKRNASGQGAPVSQKLEKFQQQRVSRESNKRKRDLKDDGEAQREQTDKATNHGRAHDRGAPTSPPAQHAEEGEFEGFDSEGEKIDTNNGAEVTNMSVSDSDWLRAKTNRTLDLQDPDVDSKDTSTVQQLPSPVPSKSSPAPPTQDEGERPHAESSDSPAAVEVPNGRLFVRNLAFSTSEDDLESLFSAYGKLEESHIVKDNRTSKSKGLGFVQFVHPEDASKAMLECDGQPFQGRLLHILPASDPKKQNLTDFDISKLPLKQQKALKRKAEAAKTTFSWNSLYMNPDAVLASTAQRLGVSKADLLDPSSADAAVKQAHAETSIIQETKEYLRKQGINIDAFSQRQRDDRSLLLKNFPYGTTTEDLDAMLRKFGAVERIVFPPTGTMAIALFHEAFEAQSALKGLAYSNLKGAVLYLEKGPKGLFDPQANVEPSNDAVAEDSGGATSESGLTSTVFVRNLNFATSTARLAEVFRPLTGFLSARVKTRSEKSRPGEVLSMGFGFVEFRTRALADAAVSTMNGHRLDGHELLVQISNRALDAAEERRKEDSSKKADQAKTKIIIKNLPFEASKKDLRALFGEYGALRSIRMPRKFDNSARGFAFADFVTAKEAQSAMQALSNTHLLGRKLVLDFAEGEADDPEATIKAMEQKAGRQAHLTTVNKMISGSARRKFTVDARDNDTN
ncbi:uncharacterized protein HMPREF1541_01046 [Cyphellophora europaea CBS 101466]|uniref:Multiple RNA-binding domain-containing protein 1 n=1 Tax=Cyphellophora europaea (strain CBS 101466) TaxID=1220924 RepID=W2SDU2_CYPE1|nr:uncharacterized protein HMPREF1541_01046 [Cyphellophora europaea CBS 101466]ETN46857.1 hypothetical protein HMPREF1541_01046 [Cyphellophora europaea CBS 101466]